MTRARTSRSSRALLETAYDDLGFSNGALLTPSQSPSTVDGEAWQSLGEWLMLGSRVGADRIFFVGDDPVVVFTKLPRGAGETEVVAAYRRAWSLGRARCLFLASESELRVYALTSPPPRGPEDAGELTPLDVVERSADVIEALASYHRDRVESGALFEETPFRRDGRADDLLLRDVASATEALVSSGLPRRVAHGLIERVILIRYMEDREIVVPSYLQEIADRENVWQASFSSESLMPTYGTESAFVRCLADRELTYAVFAELAQDFNGDMFTIADAELELVSAEHLILIQRLLTGSGFTAQEPLFLWAYDFSVVPTGLISSMYERFYRADSDDQSSTHYTPQELVEYVTSQVLTDECLAGNPRVCDPACGSGIFLVEAYRTIVRHEMVKRQRRLPTRTLRDLLLTRIAGIDINTEAIRLAAFSLYLAFLSYQSPRDIRRAGPLPKLIDTTPSSATWVLKVADAFSSDFGTYPLQLVDGRDASPTRASQGYDVVIGNPPWDEPRQGPASAADTWARENSVAIGDRNPSQLFLWRSLSLLESRGTAALLVNATAFHNARRTSQLFRKQWLHNVELLTVVNFSSARHVFFNGAVAPFMLVIYRKKDPQSVRSTLFRTVRPSRALRASKSLAFASTDRRWVEQDALEQRDYLWKVYTWGSHRDAAFMSRLGLEKTVADLLPAEPNAGWGYQRGVVGQRGTRPPSDYLASLPSLDSFEPWGALDNRNFEDPPVGVKREPDERLYSGQRILIGRGIRVGFGPRSRLVSDPMSFRHKIYCLPLQNLPDWQAKTVWATLLSSLGRYSIFMHSGSWGLWHDSVLGADILSTPVRIPSPSSDISKAIVSAVDSLTSTSWAGEGLFNARTDVPQSIDVINEVIFDLFELTVYERALVSDFHAYLLGYAGGSAYQFGSTSVLPPSRTFGSAREVEAIEAEPLRSYVDAFLRIWNPRLAPDGALAWHIVAAPRQQIIAVIFDTFADEIPTDVKSEYSWDDVLSRISSKLEMHLSSSLTAESVIRVVTDTSIIVIKRDSPRFWSASAAAEDAEATMLQAMNLRG